MKNTLSAAVLIAVVLASLVPAGGTAATAGRVVVTAQGQLTYNDQQGLSSTLVFTRTSVDNRGSTYEVRETGSGVSLSTGGTCRPAGTGVAICDLVVNYEVLLGGGNDRFTLVDRTPSTSPSVTGRIFGGTGNDTIVGDRGASVIRGEEQDDVIQGGLGADQLSGGPHANGDTVSYTDRGSTEAITAGGNSSSAGAEGEGDTLDGTFERIIGGQGADFLGVSFNPTRGPMELIGNTGNDRLIGGAGPPSGNSADTVRGFDGDDVLFARDGVRDTSLNCGGGTADRVSADLEDARAPTVISNCESIDTAPVNAGPNLRIASSAGVREGQARLRLSCPRAEPIPGTTSRDTRTKPCRGTVRLGARAVPFAAPLGGAVTVDVPLPPRLRQQLSSRSTVRARAIAVERVHPKGPNTTIQTVTLRR